MKDYYHTIFQKFIEAENELDDLVIKNIINVVQEMNYVDLLLIVSMTANLQD